MKQCEAIEHLKSLRLQVIADNPELIQEIIQELKSQRDELLAACWMALKRRPFPVGWTGLKQALEDAVARAEGET